MDSITKQVTRQGGREESGERTAPPRDLQGAALPGSGGDAKSLRPLPQLGDKFTEVQMRERFDVSTQGGIRESLTSSDIILVRNVHSDYDNVEEGRHITYIGQYYEGKHDQMIGKNLKLAKSRENGRRVLYFVKQDGVLEFNGLVECVASRHKDDPMRPGALAFELEMIDGAVGVTAERQNGPADLPRSSVSAVPDLEMIMEVERQIFDRRRFSSRSELVAALPVGMDSAKLDRILNYLEYSEKITIDDGSIRWSFSGVGSPDGLNTGHKDGDALTTTAATEEPVHILTLEERLSPDLDNDLPYSEEIERAIADCEAGRNMGKTYTAEEYREHLRREYGIDTVEHQAE